MVCWNNSRASSLDGFLSGNQDNKRFNQLVTFGVRHTYHGSLHDGRVFQSAALSTSKGPNPVITGFDDIVSTAHKPPVAVFVKGGFVTGKIQSMLKMLQRFLPHCLYIPENNPMARQLERRTTICPVMSGSVISLPSSSARMISYMYEGYPKDPKAHFGLPSRADCRSWLWIRFGRKNHGFQFPWRPAIGQ